MTNLSHQERKAVVSDLTALFNDLAYLHAKRNPYYAGAEKRNELLKDIAKDVAKFIDFHTELNLQGEVIRGNFLTSTELVAIDIVDYIRKTNREPEAISALYRAIRETSKANDLPFDPVYKPKLVTPSA